uniref:Calcium and integrin binding 1 n=1 Tax=Amazona collaria TaxID=241587 RepID=A0A8B9FUK7_9PSIT
MVHGGAAAEPVEAHAEPRVRAEERGLQRPAQRRLRERLRQLPRRLRQQQDVAALQRAGVDGHQQRVGGGGAGPAQPEQDLSGPQPREVEGSGVEGLPEALHQLRRAPLGAALDVELGHQAHGAGQDTGGQRPQPVPEEAALHPVGPALQQRPVEAGQRGVGLGIPPGCLLHEVLLPVHELLGARLLHLGRHRRPCPRRGFRVPWGGAWGHGSGGVTRGGAARAAMGGSVSLLPREALGEYQELTFLSKQEILLAYKRFSELLPKEERANACSARVPKSRILTLPELRANPFQHRICHVFSTSDDGDDSMSFEDFLDMLSVFSDSATSDIKSHYAFRIFDFDDDGTLDRKDLEKLVNCLTGQGEESRLSGAEMEQLIQNILEESDIDKDGTINMSEFQHVVSRSPDFARYGVCSSTAHPGGSPAPIAVLALGQSSRWLQDKATL